MQNKKKIELPDKEEKVTISKRELVILQQAYKKRERKRDPVDLIEGEVWKVIPGGDGTHFVSTEGRIKRSFELKCGEHREYLLRPIVRKGGYHSITYNIQEKLRVSTYIQRLVMFVFRPVKNMDNLQVLHEDCDPTNNRLSNLRWASVSETKRHRLLCAPVEANKTFESRTKTGRMFTRKTRYSDSDIKKMVTLYNEGFTQLRIAEMMGCGQDYVSKIVNGKMRANLFELPDEK